MEIPSLGHSWRSQPCLRTAKCHPKGDNKPPRGDLWTEEVTGSRFGFFQHHPEEPLAFLQPYLSAGRLSLGARGPSAAGSPSGRRWRRLGRGDRDRGVTPVPGWHLQAPLLLLSCHPNYYSLLLLLFLTPTATSFCCRSTSEGAKRCLEALFGPILEGSGSTYCQAGGAHALPGS